MINLQNQKSQDEHPSNIKHMSSSFDFENKFKSSSFLSVKSNDTEKIATLSKEFDIPLSKSSFFPKIESNLNESQSISIDDLANKGTTKELDSDSSSTTIKITNIKVRPLNVKGKVKDFVNDSQKIENDGQKTKPKIVSSHEEPINNNYKPEPNVFKTRSKNVVPQEEIPF